MGSSGVEVIAPIRSGGVDSVGVSKTLAPALRIGWVFTPPRFRDAILTEKYLCSRGVPQLDQAALARLIESGRFDRHLRRVRDRYRRRRDALVSAVAESMAGATITGLDAGHHALLQLPTGTDEQRVVAQARAAGLVVRGLGEYRVTPDDATAARPFPPALVIGFGNVSTGHIRDGIGVLGALVTPTARRAGVHRSAAPFS